MGPRLRQFADPTVICSIVLLLLNDRVLKGNGPAWLTGKLSDFAGVFLVAMIVGIVTARPDLAIATTGVGFSMIKVSYGAAQLAAPVLGGVTRQDRSDLIALLALVPAWLTLRRTPSPLMSGSFGALLATTSLVFAGVGVTATSCIAPNYVDAFATDSNGALVARITVPDYITPESAFQWARSIDGGVSWQQIPNPHLAFSTPRQACDQSGQCFRVIKDLRVEQSSANGDWDTAFGFTAEQRARMNARSGDRCGVSDVETFGSVIVVEAQPQTRVIVAMGTQGVLVRTPDGQWHRRAVLDLVPLSQQGPAWLADAVFAPLIALLLSPLVLAVAWRRSGKPRAFAIATGSAVAQFLLLLSVGMMLIVDIDYLFYGPFTIAAAMIALAASFVVAFTLGPRPSVLTPLPPWTSAPWPPPPPPRSSPPLPPPPPPPPPPPMTDR